MEDRRNTCGVLNGKIGSKKPLRRPRRSWENDDKLQFREV
jgi:hypothetical protein